MQESSGERFNRRCQRPASDPSEEEEKKQLRRNKGCQKSHDLKREKKGQDKKRTAGTATSGPGSDDG